MHRLGTYLHTWASLFEKLKNKMQKVKFLWSLLGNTEVSCNPRPAQIINGRQINTVYCTRLLREMANTEGLTKMEVCILSCGCLGRLRWQCLPWWDFLPQRLALTSRFQMTASSPRVISTFQSAGRKIMERKDLPFPFKSRLWNLPTEILLAVPWPEAKQTHGDT